MDPFRGADKKLGELMLRGWTLLSDCCSVSSCACPLMRSPDGQKYCVNCEAWILDNKKREKKNYNELFQSKLNQVQKEKKEPELKKETQPKNETQKEEIKPKIEKQEKKNNEEQKKKETQPKNETKKEEIKPKIEKQEKKNNEEQKPIPNDSVIQLLDNKLKMLANNLIETTDNLKSTQIIELMDKIITLIEHYKKIINA